MPDLIEPEGCHCEDPDDPRADCPIHGNIATRRAGMVRTRQTFSEEHVETDPMYYHMSVLDCRYGNAELLEGDVRAEQGEATLAVEMTKEAWENLGSPDKVTVLVLPGRQWSIDERDGMVHMLPEDPGGVPG